MPPYCVLAMDGGGIRGVLTARLLQRLEERFPGFLARTDLFAGTSTGSVLAVALAMQKPNLGPEQLVELYQQKSKDIFHTNLWHEVGDLWGLTGAKYDTQGRFDAIHPVIGDVTLGDIRKKLLVATFQLDSANPHSPAKPDTLRAWKAKFFHNFERDSDGSANADLPTKAIDVIMRSSAAPTYFPIYQGYIDGGVVANNPGMCALAQAVNPATGHQSVHNVVLLSIGTGARPQFLTSKDGNWGLQQWGFKLIDLLFDGSSGLADYQCSQLLGDCYQRLNPDLSHLNNGQPIGLDTVNQIDMLIRLADDLADSGKLDDTADWLKKQWTA